MMTPPIMKTSGSPPWLWIWTFIFIVNLPASLHLLLQNISQGPSALFEFIVLVALTLGLLLTFLPWVRASYLENRFRLRVPPSLSTLSRISEFVNIHAPGLQVKANLLRFDQLAFVYPSNFRKTTLALFGGMIRLWQMDQKVAEAILLHEIAHYRRGDMLIAGTGSFLEQMIRYALPCYLILFLIPNILVTFNESQRSLREVEAITGTRIGSMELLGRIAFFAKSYGWITAGSFIQLFTQLIPFLAGIWSAELNADQYAREKQGMNDAVYRALTSLSGNTGWWSWLLLRLSHPPVSFRRRFLTYRSRRALFLLLLVFPLSYFLFLMGRHAHAMTAYIQADMTNELWRHGITNTKLFFASSSGYWFSFSAALLLWPYLFSTWEFIFTGEKQQTGARCNCYGIYVLCGGVTALVGAFGYSLKM